MCQPRLRRCRRTARTGWYDEDHIIVAPVRGNKRVVIDKTSHHRTAAAGVQLSHACVCNQETRLETSRQSVNHYIILIVVATMTPHLKCTHMLVNPFVFQLQQVGIEWVQLRTIQNVIITMNLEKSRGLRPSRTRQARAHVSHEPYF
jgi:hypothetical protein